jgi:hypothetical protein
MSAAQRNGALAVHAYLAVTLIHHPPLLPVRAFRFGNWPQLTLIAAD